MRTLLFYVCGIFFLTALSNLAQAEYYFKDAYPSEGASGNFLVEVCGDTVGPTAPNESSNFSFWINNAPANILAANRSQCGAGPFFNNMSDFLQRVNSSGACGPNPPMGGAYDQCAKFALNATWSNSQTPVNVTTHMNLSAMDLWTLNYLNIKSSIGNAIIMTQNITTMLYDAQGPALTDAYGYYIEHCLGPLTGGLCLPVDIYPGACQAHGIPFPDAGMACSNGTKKLILFDFISSNSTNITADLGSAGFISASLTTPIAIAMIQSQPFFGNPGEMPAQPEVSRSMIFDADGNLLFDMPAVGGGMGGPGGSPPGFVLPLQKYSVRLNGSINGTLFDNNYSFMPIGKGMSGAIVTIKNAAEFTTFIGKVVNESGSAITNGIVYAQPLWGFTPPLGTGLVNSSFTDGTTGVFRLRVPKNIPYKFYIVANDTNPSTGSLIYNPTVDTNNGRGYMAVQDTVILSPLVIKNGGTINLNVVLNSASGVQSELSKITNIPEGIRRTAFSTRMSPVSIFETVSPPTSMLMSLVAPVNNVLLNIYGVNISGSQNGPPPVTHVCFNSTNVVQGQNSEVTCTLNNTPGTLNLIVNDCRDSVFVCSQSQQAMDIWFNSRIVIYNAADNSVAADIEEGSMAHEGSFNNPGQVQIKLPVGEYNLAVFSKWDWNAPQGVYYNGSFVIAPNEMTNVTIRRQTPGWQIQPMMPFQMRSTASNPLGVAAYDFGRNPPAILNNSQIRMDVQALQLNGSYAGNMSTGLSLTFYSDFKIPGPVANPGGFNGTFRPSDYGIPAGKYNMLFNATTDRAAANQTQISTIKFPFTVSDFDIGVDLAKFSWATSETIQGKIFAFLGNGTGLNGNATVSFYDFSGAKVGATTIVQVINGEGAISIPVSAITTQTDFYELLVVLNASGSFGFANNYIQITNFIISTTYDKQNYKPEEQVKLTVKVSNASGSPISSANVEGLVDSYQNSTFGTTDSTGSATLTFSPGTIAGGNWTFGFHSVRLKIAYSTGTEVIQQETFSGFEVRGFDVRIQTDKPAYQPTDNLTLNIFIQGFPGSPELLVDGVQYEPGGGDISVQPFGFRVTIMPVGGSWSPGHHSIKFSFSQGSSTQSAYTGFDVNTLSIMASPDKFTYQAGENAIITVKVVNTSTSLPVPGIAVNGTLYKFQQSGDLTISTNSSSTDVAGTAILNFNNLTKTGFHYVKIIVGGNQVQYVGFQVSGMSVQVTTDRPTYSPGDIVNITINATSTESVIGASVSAMIYAFGSATELPTTGITFVGSNPYLASFTYTIPADAPAIRYFLDIRVTTSSGSTGFGSAPLEIGGGMKLSVFANRPPTSPYRIGEPATFTATLLNGNNNTAINQTNITFEIGSPTGTINSVGSALTDSSGKAMLTVSSGSMPSSDGNYYLRAYVTSSPSVQAFTGFVVSSLLVTLSVGSTKQFSLGQNITFNVTAINATTGSPVNATSGTIIIWDRNRGEINFEMSVSGSQPYTLTQTIPTDTSAIGTYTVVALISVNSVVGSDSIMISVQNASAPVNITLPGLMNASQRFFVNISLGGVTSQQTASLRVFSPSASNVTLVNSSINFTGGSVLVPVNISTPGKYVFFAEVTNFGTAYALGNIVAASGAQAYNVWTTNSTSSGANDTSFSLGETVYVWSNSQNTTAFVMTQNTTTNSTYSISLPVVGSSGAYYYTTYSPTITGTYFVRLDTSTASGVAVGMFKVT